MSSPAATQCGPRSESHYVVFLALLLAAQAVASDLYLPALPAIAAALGNPSLTLTGLMLAFGIAQFMVGTWADRYGRRPVILWGSALFAASGIAGGFSTELWMLVLCRVIQGMALAAMVVCARATVRDLYNPLEGTRVLSRGLTGLGMIALAAPLVGALLTAWISWRASVIAVGVFGMIGGLWAWRYYDESRPQSVASQGTQISQSAWQIIVLLLRGPRFRAWALLASSSYGTLFAFLIASPFVYITVFGFTPLQCGIILAVNAAFYISGTFLCRRLLRHRNAEFAVKVSTAIALSGGALMLLTALFSGSPQIWSMLLGQYLFATSHGVNLPCGQAGSIGDFPQFAGRAAALSGFIMMLVAFVVGQTLTPWLGQSAWPLLIATVCGVSLSFLLAWLVVPAAYRQK